MSKKSRKTGGFRLQTKFLMGTFGLVLLLGISIIVFVQTVLFQKLEEELKRRGVTIATDVAAEIRDRLLAGDILTVQTMVFEHQEREENIEYIFLMDEEGRVLAHTFEGGFPTELKNANVVEGDQSYKVKRLATEKGVIFDIGVPLLKGTLGVAHIGMLEAPVRRSVAHIINLILGIVAGVLIIGGIGAIMLARIIANPVSELIKVTEAVGKGDLDKKAPIRTGDEIGQLAASFNTMTEELRKSREALADEKERLAVTLRSIGDGVMTTDTEGRVVLLNKEAEALSGWTHKEAKGKPLTEIFNIINEKTGERCEDPVERVLKAGEIIGLASNTVLVAKDGTERIIADSAAPIRDREGNIIGVVLVFRDITRQRKMEEELLKTSKLESLGIVAGGIAHDFNNLLTSIIGNVSLAKTYENLGNEVIEILTDAENACWNAKDLTQQLLTFSSGGAPIREAASISELLKNTATFAVSDSNARCEFEIPNNIRPVSIDEGQIRQVIDNMIINARQAMPKGGTIKISAENVSMGAENPFTLKKGEYIKIAIEDQGTGMSEEVLKKVFDPYFSTKEMGTQKGMGLGLSVCHSIVKKHDGHITVESKMGVGTTFHVYLPATQKQMTTNKDVEEKPHAAKGNRL